MSSSLLVLLLAVTGYSILSVSQAGQKIGLHTIPVRPLRGWTIWAAATAGTAVSFFLVLAALGIGSVALVGAMTGTGMAALTVVSHHILGERVGRRELLGVSLIALGAGVVGVVPFERSTGARTDILAIALTVVTVTYLGATLIARRRQRRGIILGGLAGSLAAFSQLFQKMGTLTLSLDEGVQALALDLIRNTPILISIGITVLSMLIAQAAYTRGEAIRIIPSYTAHASAVPVLGGVVVFDERLGAVHWFGILLLFFGTMILVFARRPGASSSGSS